MHAYVRREKDESAVQFMYFPSCTGGNDDGYQNDAANLSVFARVSVEVAPLTTLSVRVALTPSSWRNVGPTDGDALRCIASGAI